MITFGEMLDAAQRVVNEEQADALVDALVDDLLRVNPKLADRSVLRRITLSNIGYMTGYCDWDVAERIFRLFKTEHPVFGTRRPTMEEAFGAGIKLGTEMKAKRQLQKPSQKQRP